MFKNSVNEDTTHDKPKITFDIKYKALNRKYISLYSISNSTTNKYRIGNNDISIFQISITIPVSSRNPTSKYSEDDFDSNPFQFIYWKFRLFLEPFNILIIYLKKYNYNSSSY